MSSAPEAIGNQSDHVEPPQVVPLDRRSRRLLARLDWAVLTVVDVSGEILTVPVQIEAVTPHLVALRTAPASLLAGESEASLCAHFHDASYSEFAQCIVFGRVSVSGEEARFAVRRSVRSRRRRGLLGEITTGVRSAIAGRRTLARWERDPLPLDLLEKVFAGGDKQRTGHEKGRADPDD